MTESEWNTCTSPEAMLDWLRARGTLSDRKARLFSVAVCRRLWPLLTDERSRRAVEVAERQADGLTGRADVASARREATDACQDAEAADGNRAGANAAAYVLDADASFAARFTACAAEVAVAASVTFRPSSVDVTDRWDAAVGDERAIQADLLRDLFDPFRPPASVDAWRTAEVVGLAGAAYADRLDPARLAALAQALADAGCADAELLGHLRGEGPHVRGCWGLDVLLGRA